MAKTFKEFWGRMRAANVSLNDSETKMTLSVAAFEKQMEKAYKQGAKDGMAFAHDMKELEEKSKPKSPLGEFGDLFKGVF